MTLLNAATKTAEWAWDSLERAISLGRKIGEESITDFFLIHLTELTRGSVRIIDINKADESLKGADWEWWFVDSMHYSLPFRVQAKIIDFNPKYSSLKPRYKQLHYPGSKKGFLHGHQTTRLIRRCMIDHMLPLYCLYTKFDTTFLPTGNKCYAFSTNKKSFSISLIGAYEVNSTKSNLLEDIFEDVHAFECVFSESYTLSDIQDWFFNRYRVNITSYGNDYIRPPLKIPAYISSAILSDGLPTDAILPNETNRVTIFLMENQALSYL